MAKKKKIPCCRLSIKALAVAGAVLWGGYLFLLVLLSDLGIFWFSPEVLALMASIYPGLAVGITGAFIGLIWGLICGAICGAIIAWIHNLTLERVG